MTLEDLVLPLIRSVTPVDPDDIDACPLVYCGAEEAPTPDENTCLDPGGHVFRHWREGERCLHCDERLELP